MGFSIYFFWLYSLLSSIALDLILEEVIREEKGSWIGIALIPSSPIRQPAVDGRILPGRTKPGAGYHYHYQFLLRSFGLPTELSPGLCALMAHVI